MYFCMYVCNVATATPVAQLHTSKHSSPSPDNDFSAVGETQKHCGFDRTNLSSERLFNLPAWKPWEG